MASKFSRWDFCILSVLTVLLTWHPYYLHGKLNLFELGLYLPGIEAILQGQVPFRDFFYLRGPFELYVPAFLMHIFGTQVAVLETYFYVGTVLTLIVCIAIAKELYPSRGFLYVMALVLVVRTFPRVVFTFWGGLRYAWGVLSVFCLVRFLKSGHKGWMAAAGILSAIAFWTSFEIGVSAAIATAGVCVLALLTGNLPGRFWKSVFIYAAGFLVVFIPYVWYLAAHQALWPCVQTIAQIATTMTKNFPEPGLAPGLGAFLNAVFNPSNPNFRHMTTVYGYVFLVVYLFWKWRRRKLDIADMGIAAVGFYGLMLYIGAFRNIWASQYEMALQPWKIVHFFLLMQVWMVIKNSSLKSRQIIAGVLLAAVALSSVIYSVSRLNKRFFTAKYLSHMLAGKDTSKLKPLANESTQRLDLPRTQGIVVPLEQAKDLTQLNDFLKTHTASTDKVLMYPEMGAVHFIVQRPWIGRFPTVTLSWLSPQWQSQWLAEAEAAKPQVAVVLKEMPEYFENIYFQVPTNRRYFEENMDYIRRHYQPVSQTSSWTIYERRGQ